jgi:uncharacterized protein YecT (DUF1311 family)
MKSYANCWGNTMNLQRNDINRAESSTFGKSADFWLQKNRNIWIKLHDMDCEEVFFSH